MLTAVKKSVVDNKKEFFVTASLLVIMSLIMSVCSPAFVFAASASELPNLVKQLINIITSIFRIVGVLLGAYSIGQLVLAFKNEDADSKTRASSTLVVAFVLIILPSIVENLHLEKYATITP